MLGALCWDETKKHGISLERTQVCGLPVLQARVRPGGRWEHERIARAARMLYGQGIRRILLPRAPLTQELLCRQGLSIVEPLALYRAMAAHMVLAELERRGMGPERSTVILRGEYADSDLARTAWLLCPRVRQLVLDVSVGGDRLARELYWQYGAAVCLRGQEQAQISVCFDGEKRDSELALCRPEPELLGMELRVDGLDVPEDLEPASVLTALWQAGRVPDRNIRVLFGADAPTGPTCANKTP